MVVRPVITLIDELCAADDNNFVEKTRRLYELLDRLSDTELSDHLEVGGMIPESIAHDSSQEKLFAKYCDYLLARGLRLIGLDATPIAERADAADVEASGKDGSKTYQLVGDAKAFRLSRTAKNQKDFKVDALDRWKKGADYAVLLSPGYQYPTKSSQIYLQAIEKRVTLLSYAHLAFLVANRRHVKLKELRDLWFVYATLPKTKDAWAYWGKVDGLVAAATGKTTKDLKAFLAQCMNKVKLEARVQLQYWEARRAIVEKMNANEAREALIKAYRIDSNITTIRSFLEELERTPVL